MDDGCLIHESKEYLQCCLKEIQKACKKADIVLNDKKTVIVKLSRGFTWIKTKFYILDSGRILRKPVRESATKMRKKLRTFREYVNQGIMTLKDVYMSFQSWRAYMLRFDSHYTLRHTTAFLYFLFPEFEGDLKNVRNQK